MKYDISTRAGWSSRSSHHQKSDTSGMQFSNISEISISERMILVKISKNLAKYKSKNNFVGQNNYVDHSNRLNIKMLKLFAVLLEASMKLF